MYLFFKYSLPTTAAFMWNHIISRVCFPNFHVSSVGFLNHTK
nr:MAG TPA: hypothetical protein [Caudoviricetes sp.]DAZ42578.1 MAG TPA: hypothetical protein [Caudoviricetes sp.]